MPSKYENGGRKRRQNSKVTAKSATTQISEKKGMVAESAIKMEKWWREMPPKHQSDGKKCHHFSNLVEQCGGFGFWIFRFKIRVVVKSGGFIVLWWNFNHHISNCGGTFTTTYHIYRVQVLLPRRKIM